MDTHSRLGKRPIGFSSGQAMADALGTPAWRPVDTALLSTQPWASICAISVVAGDHIDLAGTGWLAGPSTVITAAHVVANAVRGNGAIGFQVRFPGNGITSTALDAHFHDKYRGDPAEFFDPFDIAALRIADPGLPSLAMAGPGSAADAVEVAGYPPAEEGRLVLDTGSVQRLAGGVILHTADTHEGHSGAPVLVRAGADQQRVALALHVQGYRGNPEAARFPQHNVALALENELADFVRAHLGAA